MDPATAFSIACGVVQLIEFGLSTAASFQEIYKSNTALTFEIDNLNSKTTSLDTAISSLSTRLSDTATTKSLSRDQKQLHQVALDCNKLSQDLLDQLDKLKISGRLRKRDVPAQWLKVTREKAKIERTCGNLSRLKAALDTQMLVNLWCVALFKFCIIIACLPF